MNESNARFKSFEDGFDVEICKQRFNAGVIGKDNFNGYSKQ